MNDNVIYTDNDEAIGFYKDLYKPIADQAKDLLDRKDVENAQTQIENLNDLTELKDYDGLIIVSDNNGMGFTASKYEPKGEE